VADLEKHETATREGSIQWAIELVRRGLWPAEDYITVHGPHEPPADRMWSEAEVWIDGGWGARSVYLQTIRGIGSIGAVRGVPVRDREDRHLYFPVEKASELPPLARRWLRVARRVRERRRA
jgi:hypothetical protein